MQLNGSVALVTGGAGGLGEATVRRLVAGGASVLIADVAEDRAAKLADDLGPKARYLRTDVTEEDSVLAAVEAARALGPLRFVVATHGGWGVVERMVSRDGTPAALDGFTKTTDLYLTGTCNVLRLAASAMAGNQPNSDGQRGVVVTTASIAAFEGQIGQSAYSAAEGGVVSLTLVAARDLAPLGVRVMCIAPGTMRTPIMESIGEETLAHFGAAVPFPQRLGRPEEYASLAAHIAENDYLNGEVIRLDGAQRLQPR